MSTIVPIAFETSGGIASLDLVRKVAAGKTGTWRRLSRLVADESTEPDRLPESLDEALAADHAAARRP
jgi:hypothetical protein